MLEPFDRFTQHAFNALSFAKEEARRLNHNLIGTEHLVLGLVREGEGIGAMVLEDRGVSLSRLRAAVEPLGVPGESPGSGEIGLTDHAKRALELAVDESRRLNHPYVGTEHLLLGLVREDDGKAAAILKGMGVNLEIARRDVHNMVSRTPSRQGRSSVGSEGHAVSTSKQDRATEFPQQTAHEAALSASGAPVRQFTDRARRVQEFAREEAIRLNHDSIGTEHLLLGLILAGEGVGMRVLNYLGADPEGVRIAGESLARPGEQPVKGEAGLSPDTQKALDLAIDEARRLKHSYVGTAHVLLGLLREDEGKAAAALNQLGVTLARARQRVHDVHSWQTSREIRHDLIREFLPGSERGSIHTETPSQEAPGKGARQTFDRFTERSRKVLELAQEEARRFNHNYIGTEHLLLGMVREGDCVAARVLNNMGVQLPKVRSAVEFIIGRGESTISGDIGLTPRAKKVLELAVDEGRRLNHPYIGTEHLLLGLVREGEGIAAGVLESLGVVLEEVRSQVHKVISSPGSTTTPSDPQAFETEIPIPPRRTKPGAATEPSSGETFDRFTESARRVLDLALNEATRFNHDYIGTEHLLLGLVREGDGVAIRVLNRMGVQLPKVRSAVEFIISRGEHPVAGDTGLTPRAKQVLRLAVDESNRLEHEVIGTEHLLLGLVREGESMAAGVLASFGVDLENVRRMVVLETMDDDQLAEYQAMEAAQREWERLDPRLPAGINWRTVKRAIDAEAVAPVGEIVADQESDLVKLAAHLDIPLNDYARAALDNASLPAERPDLGRTWSEHLLIAVLELRTGAAHRLLIQSNLHAEIIRSFSRRLWQANPDAGNVGGTAVQLVTQAGEERLTRTEPLGTIHLLMALLREEKGQAAMILSLRGVDVSANLAALELLLALDAGPEEDDGQTPLATK